jgi:serine/threonine protein kinase/Flp pilus assembly protein TadD
MYSKVARDIDSLSAPPSAETDQVIQILEVYLAELEQGCMPHPDALLAQYPEHAERLRAYLNKLDLLHEAATSLRGSPVAEGADGAIDGTSPGRLGDYTILREVGRGGMGLVYEAFQVSLSRRVALKVLPFAAALDPRQLQRFRKEAQAAAQLSHPNIVPIFGIGSEKGIHYYAMQFIEGRTLAAVIREMRQGTQINLAEPTEAASMGGPCSRPALNGSAQAKKTGGNGHVAKILPPESPGATAPCSASAARLSCPLSTGLSTTMPAFFRAVAEIGIQVAEALEHAHQMGVVHRDIKPANLLVDGQGKVWVTDFGLAQFRSSADLTRTGDLVGTLRYMSPEQALAKRGLVDQRTDIYSLGATLYELLTLNPLFEGRDREELLRQIAFEDPCSPRRWNRSVPVDLETILLKTTTKDPAGRYATAQELADDLNRFLRDEPIHARRPTLRQRVAKSCRRHRAVLITTVTVALLGLTASTLMFWQGKVRTQREAKETRAVADEMYTFLQTWLGFEPYVEEIQRKPLEAVLAFYEKFAKSDGADPEDRYKAAQASHRVGEIHLALAQWPPQESAQHYRAAEEAANQAIARLEPLAAKYPTDFQYQQELADSHMTLGAVLQATRRSDAAEAAFRLARERLNLLADSFPSQREYRDKLATCNGKLASLLSSPDPKRSQQAEDAFGNAQSLLEKLAADFPQQLQYSYHLAEVYINHGDLVVVNRPEDAEQFFRQAITLLSRLLKDPRHTPDFEYHMGLAYHSLGSAIEQTEAGQVESANQRMMMLCSFPQLSLQLAGGLCGLESLAGRRLRLGQAEEAYKLAKTFYEKLVVAWPQVPRYQGRLGLSIDRLAQFQRQRGDLDAARQLTQQAVLHQRAALVASPENITYGFGLQEQCHHLADILLALGDHAGAAQAAQESAHAVVRCPVGEEGAMLILYGCAPLAQRDRRLSMRERHLRAEQYLAKAAELGHQAAETCQLPAFEQYAKVQNNIAWFFSACPDVRYRDPNLAVKLAERAVQRQPQDSCFRNTLGLAYYRKGDWQAAIKTLNKAIELSAGRQTMDWLFLAMAQWQAGNKEQARNCFRRGTQRRTDDEEICRFRAEAAALIGLPYDTTPMKEVVRN